MTLFKDYKRKTLSVTVQGQEFNFVEPSALTVTNYHVDVTPLHNKAKEIDDQFVKQKLYLEINFKLVAICLVDQFPEVDVEGIYKALCDEITEFDDIKALTNAAEEICGLKLVESDTQDENSQED